MERIVIIGAGVIGCAIAHELKKPSNEVYVIEKNSSFGQGITSRNSGVIHSGLYYKPNSLKANLCIEGQKRLYRWCKEKNVASQKTGKFILAQHDEEQHLKNLYQNALQCGVDPKTLFELNTKDLQKKIPLLSAKSALYISESGIIDPHQFCQSLYVSARAKEVEFLLDTEVQKISQKSAYEIQTNRGEIKTDVIINAAGLYADEIAQKIGILKYKIYPWRGDYFKLKSPHPLPALVYPAVKKNASGLGVHITRDLQGSFRLGPDVERIDAKDNFCDRPEKREMFFKAAQSMLSFLKPEMISYDSCGIRPKLKGPEDTEEKDFIISEDKPGLINLIGIESPGLTAALAIAKHVRSLL